MSKLYIVATPIGNLADITFRAIEILESVDLILCEDTRVTSKLLARYKIKKPLLSYHQHSKLQKINEIISLLSDGQSLALVTDAGTPGISDPGNELIKKIFPSIKRGGSAKQSRGVSIIPIPGPSAVTAALSVSGLKSDEFLFLGFLPKKKGRAKALEEIVDSRRTAVFYESTHRIIKTLEELETLLRHSGAKQSGAIESRDPISRSSLQDDSGCNRQIVIARELTKLHETIYRGTTEVVIAKLKDSSHKGEFTVVVEGAK